MWDSTLNWKLWVLSCSFLKLQHIHLWDSAKLITSNLFRHGYILHAAHHFSTSPPINLHNYLIEMKKKTPHNRINPKGNCIFLSTHNGTNKHGFRICTDSTHRTSEETENYFHLLHKNINPLHRHPKNQKFFSGNEEAISSDSLRETSHAIHCYTQMPAHIEIKVLRNTAHCYFRIILGVTFRSGVSKCQSSSTVNITNKTLIF